MKATSDYSTPKIWGWQSPPECFEQICVFLWGNIVLRLYSIHHVYPSYAIDGIVPKVDVFFRLKEDASITDGGGTSCTPIC